MWYIYDHEKRNADSFLLPCNINSTLIALNVVSVIKEEYSGIVPTEYKNRIEDLGERVKSIEEKVDSLEHRIKKLELKRSMGP